MRPKLVLTTLAVRDFRNLARVDLTPSPRFNIVSGQNGQGKTSLLEALYFVATSRSFRTSRPAELVRHGAGAASVRASFVEQSDESGGLPPLSREQLAAIDGSRCSVRIDGARPPTLAAFATCSPVVAFHPDEMALSTGPASLRRTLLDRLALFLGAASADHRARYERALKARQELLRRPGAPAGDAEIEAFEQLAARHGAAVTRARGEAAVALIDELMVAFRRIAAPGLTLDARYSPGGSADEAEAAAALLRARRADAVRPTASFGPHRDDLVLSLDGKSARVVASQGQHRAITLALKAAEVATIGRARGVTPVLLLDDVSSELDAQRTDALFEYLTGERGQIFVTTTRRPLIALPSVPVQVPVEASRASGSVVESGGPVESGGVVESGDPAISGGPVEGVSVDRLPVETPPAKAPSAEGVSVEAPRVETGPRVETSPVDVTHFVVAGGEVSESQASADP